ncbi:hypothetical protein [Caenispirillum bisanense]|uniref:Uncharacterized protein n=1 Tax=Caenispirillum bisanense TaxID=414052 RepID=A0A286H1V6_9PROT|nr:hypothetical protein [Caenispirillum bisanense]SOE01763.1 hypothetical protein SAMN05421508_12311 [Caenispirillum bisanense]
MDSADDPPSGSGPAPALGGLRLRFALEPHWWRTTRGRRRRAFLTRLRHVHDPGYTAAHLLWWCYCAMGVNLQMAGADLGEADDADLEAALAAGCIAMASWLGTSPHALATTVDRRLRGALQPGLARWLVPGRIPPEVATAAGIHLAAVLTDPAGAGRATRALFALGRRLQAGGAPAVPGDPETTV